MGTYAQAHYLPHARKNSMTAKVREAAEDFDAYAPYLPLPHPSWRVRMWMAKNPWFEDQLLPRLRAKVAQHLMP